MVNGVYLTLLIGPGIPIPAPRPVVEALSSVTVTNGVGGPSGFSLEFTLGKSSVLQTLFLLTGGVSLTPPFRVVLAVTIGGTQEVLIDGFMTKNTIVPGAPGEPSKLTIMGTDLTVVMDLIPFDGLPYPAMPVEARVLVILAKYAVLGVIPIVIPRVVPDVDNPLESIPRHQGTDLAYLEQLAAQSAYKFYLEAGPAIGTSTAYWGPEIKVGVPQPALTMNSDFETNVEGMSFSYRNDTAELPIVWLQEPITKLPIPVPIPDVSLVNPPLGLIPGIPKKVTFLDDTANISLPRAILFGLGSAGATADSVSANGTLDVVRYGRVLKARKLVGVRGAGVAFDGLYYVTEVTHTIKRGEYKQQFKLSRNGLVSTVPMVRA
jgi:hypothetical protein